MKERIKWRLRVKNTGGRGGRGEGGTIRGSELETVPAVHRVLVQLYSVTFSRIWFKTEIELRVRMLQKPASQHTEAEQQQVEGTEHAFMHWEPYSTSLILLCVSALCFFFSVTLALNECNVKMLMCYFSVRWMNILFYHQRITWYFAKV